MFAGIVAEVPFVDVLNTMLDDTLPLTAGEFIEWGNPKIAEQYAWMRAYSPYDNLIPGAYPAMLVRTGLNDTQVAYWEPSKYVAKLRTLKTDANPLLFKINLEVGHGGVGPLRCAARDRRGRRLPARAVGSCLRPGLQTSKNTVSPSPCRRMSKR